MSAPLEVLLCYAREDQEMLVHLKKHLAPLERQGQIKIWSEVNLSAGMEWKKELDRHLESANIILLLISPDFMNSEYCYSTEMRRSLQRHDEGSAQVIPILLRSTIWQDAPFAKLQIVPTNARPVTSWPDRDGAFYDITTQLAQVITLLEAKEQQSQTKDPYEAWKAEALATRLAAEEAVRSRVAAEQDANQQKWRRVAEEDANRRRVAAEEEAQRQYWRPVAKKEQEDANRQKWRRVAEEDANRRRVAEEQQRRIEEEQQRLQIPSWSSAFRRMTKTLTTLFSSRKQQRETELSLFAIARTTLEQDDQAIVGNVYTLQAGISQQRQEHFRSSPFKISVQDPVQLIPFHILFHPSENIELMIASYQNLRYNPDSAAPQFISCPFRLKAPGQSYLLINFYRERQWLKTIRFAFDGIEQSVPSPVPGGG